MLSNHPRARLALYYVLGIGGILLTYAKARGWVGDDELAAWTALGAFLGLTAASNTSTRTGGTEPFPQPLEPADVEPVDDEAVA